MDNESHENECVGTLIPDTERGGHKCTLCDYWISDPQPRWRDPTLADIFDESLPF
jgi:hypothetical protein